jgi:transcriptional regulator with XRE-family HTH domain
MGIRYNRCNSPSSELLRPAQPLDFLKLYNAVMKKPHKHFIREWREHRGLSLRRLCARMELSPGGDEVLSYASLSRIEQYKQPYSEPILNALADALDVEPWMLLKIDPRKDGQIIDLMVKLTPKQQEQAIKLLEIIKAG